MKKESIITLNYVTNSGEDKTLDFKISFISNRMIRDYGKIQDTVQKVSKSWMKLNQIKDQVKDTNRTPEESEALTKEIEKETKEIENLGTMDFFKLRFDLVKRILKRNGYTDHTQPYHKFKFWDENVAPDETLVFLTSCIQKDMVDSKKKTLDQ